MHDHDHGGVSDIAHGLLAFPRLLGIAEIGWSLASKRVWEDYRQRLAAHGLHLRRKAVNYYPDPIIPWDKSPKTSMVTLTCCSVV